MPNYRSLSAAVSAVVVCALVGGFYGRNALSAQDQVADQYKVFTAALNAIESNYVGTVESDRLVYSAISGMLQTLDPHSSFLDPRAYAQMRERQEGRYYGLGITISVIDGEISAAPPSSRFISESRASSRKADGVEPWHAAVRRFAPGSIPTAWPFGFLLVPALVRRRLSDARELLLIACIPQTSHVLDALLLSSSRERVSSAPFWRSSPT